MSDKFLLFGEEEEAIVSAHNPLLTGLSESSAQSSYDNLYPYGAQEHSYGSQEHSYEVQEHSHGLQGDSYGANAVRTGEIIYETDNANERATKRSRKAGGYVTKRFFATMLALGMVLSTAAGAGIATYINKADDPEKVEYQNLTDTSGVATTGQLTVEQIVSKNADAVVEISTQVEEMSFFGNAMREGAGSGVIIKSDGYIVTNHHVIDNAKSISVTLHNGESYPAQLVGSDAQNDIAVIKITADNLNFATIGKSSGIKVGELTVAIGNPLGSLGGTATQGIISALDRKITIDGVQLTLLQTDSAINPGNSGGGLFNSRGELIGIVVAKTSASGIEGLGFAIPIDTAAPIIDDLIANGRVTNRPAAGIRIYYVAEDQLEQFEVDAPGVYVKDVYGENIKAAGIESGDRIIAIDGEKVESSAALIAEIQSHKIGDVVTLTVVRGGKEIDITFALEDSGLFS